MNKLNSLVCPCEFFLQMLIPSPFYMLFVYFCYFVVSDFFKKSFSLNLRNQMICLVLWFLLICSAAVCTFNYKIISYRLFSLLILLNIILKLENKQLEISATLSLKVFKLAIISKNKRFKVWDIHQNEVFVI